MSYVHVQEVKSILIAKFMMAQEMGINVAFETRTLIDFILMDTIDFIRIMGIILDNAVEEVMDLKEGILRVGLLKVVQTLFLLFKTRVVQTFLNFIS